MFLEQPSQWSNLYQNCNGNQQSPINLPVSDVSICNEQVEGSMVRNYISKSDSRWVVENTGRFGK